MLAVYGMMQKVVSMLNGDGEGEPEDEEEEEKQEEEGEVIKCEEETIHDDAGAIMMIDKGLVCEDDGNEHEND